MDSYGSSSSPSAPSSSELMDQLKTQLAQAYAEEFLETVRGKCFTKCISKPGSSLSGSESSCVSRVLDDWMSTCRGWFRFITLFDISVLYLKNHL
ncbi:Mitochondrial import inner membrane translocase subunit Tim13 [Zostera marina]|uniref:Mitochondrial import inner membrane translocase subunit n=1 Tax=Zostera marina TaxID=29655 RepID=A0A0K9NR05_ZOSMR|nr:Mitochondrial import inner membrane translocase subunit Tim13 [Zostera marina]